MVIRSAAVLICILLVGCGRASAQLGASSSPTTTATVSSSPSPSPSASATAIMCRLPIEQLSIGLGGAFLDIPVTSGNEVLLAAPSALSGDPASLVKLPNGDPPQALAYDWAFKRWLPVRSQWVSPDGSQYAYTDITGRIHLVTVSTGADSVIASGSNWAVIGFTADGIYAGIRDPSAQPSLSGLWLVASGSGQVREITTSGTWTFVAADSAWSMSPTVASPNEVSGNQLVGLDLKTGSVRAWYTVPDGDAAHLLGIDPSGHPVIGDPYGYFVFRVTAPGVADKIGVNLGTGDGFADSHGVWFVVGMDIAIYLLDGTSVRPVARYGESGTVRIAGACQ